jgi:predicted alternative tryptophan synthase beta-subunit
MENWQNIYDDLSRKIIKPIDEYTSVGEFKKDVVRILKSSVIQKHNVYGSFKYKRLNTELYDKYCEQIKDRMYTKENLKKLKKPVITFIEINDWEKERWELIIPLTEKNIEPIKKFSNLLVKLPLLTLH